MLALFISSRSRLQQSFIYPYQFQYNIKSIMGGNYKAKQEFRRNQALWLFSGLWGRVEIFTLFCRVLSLPWFMKCAIKCREVDGYSEHIAGGSRAPPTTVNQPALIRYAFLVRRVKTQHLQTSKHTNVGKSVNILAKQTIQSLVYSCGFF